MCAGSGLILSSLKIELRSKNRFWCSRYDRDCWLMNHGTMQREGSFFKSLSC
jgi:hypothetical protein